MGGEQKIRENACIFCMRVCVRVRDEQRKCIKQGQVGRRVPVSQPRRRRVENGSFHHTFCFARLSLSPSCAACTASGKNPPHQKSGTSRSLRFRKLSYARSLRQAPCDPDSAMLARPSARHSSPRACIPCFRTSWQGTTLWSLRFCACRTEAAAPPCGRLPTGASRSTSPSSRIPPSACTPCSSSRLARVACGAHTALASRLRQFRLHHRRTAAVCILQGTSTSGSRRQPPLVCGASCSAKAPVSCWSRTQQSWGSRCTST